MPVQNRSLTSLEYEEITSLFIEAAKNGVNAFDFNEIHDINDFFVKHWTGLDKAQFLELANSCDNKYEALAIFLMKLRKQLTYQDLASLFKLSATTIKRRYEDAREYLHRFVAKNFGIERCSRGVVKENSTRIADALLDRRGESVIAIFDGTYIYQQKSSNFEYQKQSYSEQKARNLYKPFLVVCPNGYIIDVFGPYRANESDGTILNDLLDINQHFQDFFKQDDIFICDRGFRNSRDAVMRRDIRFVSPSLVVGQSQHTTEQANASRKVTKIRYVIEVINGHLKNRFKGFYNTITNKLAPENFKELRIIAALYNKFGVRIYSDKVLEQAVVEGFH